eukprot:Sspe_Gene.53022::Locus_29338_Transcript_1_1_Confidence_1.000_Length_674::g.53022::m.53022
MDPAQLPLRMEGCGRSDPPEATTTFSLTPPHTALFLQKGGLGENAGGKGAWTALFNSLAPEGGTCPPSPPSPLFTVWIHRLDALPQYLNSRLPSSPPPLQGLMRYFFEKNCVLSVISSQATNHHPPPPSLSL